MGGRWEREDQKKTIVGHRLVLPPLLSSFSPPTCQVIATLRLLLLQAARSVLALQIRLGWQPYATELREPVKKTPSVLSSQLGAGGRAGSGLICPLCTGAFSLQPPPRSLEEWLWGRRTCEKRNMLLVGQYTPVEIFRERKKQIPSSASSLPLPEMWSQCFSCEHH